MKVEAESEGSRAKATVSHVAIIGGGVIGLACAHYLVAAGYRVTLVDKGKIGRGCSHRNCGLVCPSHVLPLAEPGAIGAAVRALLRPHGAFRIRPRLDPALWRWLWRFARRCNRRDLIASGHAIQPLLASSLRLYRELVREIDCEWQEQGLLFVYRDRRLLEAYRPTNELLAEEFHEAARCLERDELLELEPSLAGSVAGAWYFAEDAHLSPERLLESWRVSLESRGVRFVEERAFEALDVRRGEARSARVGSESLPADVFVIATGAWTPLLADRIGCRVPLEPGKGYSVLVPRPAPCPRVPLIFPEHRVAVTPLSDGLRLGSIMEFAGYDESLSRRRVEQLRNSAAAYLRAPLREEFRAEWFGWRPMTYDSIPIIGLCPGYSNVYLATGHNMLGLSMAPATGRLVSELIRGEGPHVDPGPYRLERFRSRRRSVDLGARSSSFRTSDRPNPDQP